MVASASRSSSSPTLGRLPGGPPFDRVFREGSSASDGLLAVRFLPNEQDITRWGFGISRRTVRSSVDRNRLRRRLRAIAAQVPVPVTADVVVIARGGALTASKERLHASVSRLVKRAAARSPGRKP